MVDQLAEYTDDTITIFQGNTLVATNVMLNGKRAVGTEVSPEVKTTVLDKGETITAQQMLPEKTITRLICRSKMMQAKRSVFFIRAPIKA
nr:MULTISPECIES: cache domain-containing protein [unclassified Bacillus (in: firmicutes)]